jgi:HAD superfamily hydrolase (TIGR01490 family)
VALALFDFDGTITFKDSFAGFIKYVVGPVRYWLGIACLTPVVIGFLSGFVRASRAKELMFTYFFGGRAAPEFERLASKYSLEKLPAMVRPNALERIEWHKQKGDTVAVVSASIDLWLKGWCAAHGVDLIATRLETKGGIVSGRFLTRNCSGREKVARIKARYDLEQFDYIYAYGDSWADRAMLDIADERYYRWKRMASPGPSSQAGLRAARQAGDSTL